MNRSQGRYLVRPLLNLLVSLAVTLGVTATLFMLAAARFDPNMGAGRAGTNDLTVWLVQSSPAPVGWATGPTGDLAARANTSLPGLIASSALNSAFLVVPSGMLAVILGVPLGFWLALYAPAPLVGLLRSLTSLSVALPAFFVAFLLQIAAVEVTGSVGHTVIPVYGFGLDGHLVIPVIALTLGPAAAVTRIVAIAAVDLNVHDFARTARAKGLTEPAVLYRHLAPNMYGVIGQASLTALRLVLSALVIVEFLVVWPGVGALALRALNVQDLAVLISSVALLGGLFVLSGLALDAVASRTGRQSG